MTAQLPSSKEQLLADIAHAEEKAATLCGPCADDHARLAGYLRALLAAHEQEPSGYLYRTNTHISKTPWRYAETLPGYVVGESFEVRPQYDNPAPSIPETLPCAVLLEPGLRFGMGVQTRLLLDALQRRADREAELSAMTPEQRAEHDSLIAAFKTMVSAPSIPAAVPEDLLTAMEEVLRISDRDHDAWNRAKSAIAACRAAMLHADLVARSDKRLMEMPHAVGIAPGVDYDFCPAKPGNSPVIPDGYALVPKKLTREMRQMIHPITESCCPDCGRQVTADCEDNVLLSWDDMIAAAPKVQP